jgi:hypothetical protein
MVIVYPFSRLCYCGLTWLALAMPDPFRLGGTGDLLRRRGGALDLACGAEIMIGAGPYIHFWGWAGI